MTRQRATVCVMTCLLLLASLAAAQERPFRESVTLAVDPDAAKSWQMIHDRWDAGPDPETLQSLITLTEQKGSALVVAVRGTAGGAARYSSVQTMADELVSRLSPEQLKIYRERVDRLAEPLWKTWETTGDRQALQQIVRRAFFSRYGDNAAWELARLAWERGDLATAERLWSRLMPRQAGASGLPVYPDPEYAAADVAARLILCRHYLGFQSDAIHQKEAFLKQFPMARGELGGRTALWSELLADAMSRPLETRAGVTPEDTATFGGTPQRFLNVERVPDFGPELWTATIRNPRLPELGRVSLFGSQPAVGLHPVIEGDLVVLNDGRQIHAWNLYSGKPYWTGSVERGAVIYPVLDDPAPMIPARPTVGTPQWTATIAEGRLYARMGSAVSNPAVSEFRDLPAELVCLDIANREGAELWKLRGEDLATGDGELPPWRWEGTPLVRQGRAYALATRRRPQLEWSLVCLDAETGLVLWQRPIGITRPTPSDQENRVSQLLLTEGGGQLYVATDWGALAALDAEDGRLLWALSYENDGNGSLRPASPPPVYADGRLYAALVDGDRFVCVDAASGAILWMRPLPEPVRHVLGVGQGRVFASGRSLWAFDTTTGAIAWSIRSAEPSDWGYGRGLLVGDQVWWTSRETLWCHDQQSGATLREQDLSTVDRRSGGNLVSSQGVVLIAGPERLTAYGEYARIREPTPFPISRLPAAQFELLKQAELTWAGGDEEPAATLWEMLAQVSAKEVAARARDRLRAIGKWTDDPPTVIPARVVAVTPQRLEPPPGLGTAFLTRQWERPLNANQAVHLPARLPESPARWGVVLGEEVEIIDLVTGQSAGQLRLDAPLTWAGELGQQLLIVAGSELLAWDSVQQQLTWRVDWRHTSQRPFAQADWRLLPTGVFLWQPPGKATLYAWQDGRPLWERIAGYGVWQSKVRAVPKLIAIHTAGPGLFEVWDTATGTTTLRQPTPTGPWKEPPIFLDDNERRSLVVTEDRRIVASAGLDGSSWEYAGPISYAHAEPWIFVERERAWVVIDGCRVARFSLRTGLRDWETELVSRPLEDPGTQTARHRDRLFAAAGDELRAIDLVDGSLVWTTRIPPLSSEARVHLLQGTTEDWLVVSSASPEPFIRFYSAATGALQQTLALPRGTTEWSLAQTTAGAVIVSSHALIGLVPRL